MLDVDTVIAFLFAHKWWAAAALVIGFLVRMSKSDAVGPVVKPEWRAGLAVVLGQLSAVAEHLAAGTPWKPALWGGVVSALTAVFGYELLVKKVLAGPLNAIGGDGDVPIPGFMRSGSKKTPVPPPPLALLCVGVVLWCFAGLAGSGCSWFTPSHVSDVAQIGGCILANADLPVKEIAAKCAIEDEKQIVDLLSAHRAAMARSKPPGCGSAAPASSASAKP